MNISNKHVFILLAIIIIFYILVNIRFCDVSKKKEY